MRANIFNFYYQTCDLIVQKRQSNIKQAKESEKARDCVKEIVSIFSNYTSSGLLHR